MNTDENKYRGLPAISYARASLGKGKGQDDSTDRQIDITLEYCEKLGLVLDDNFAIVDEGVSAFKEITKEDDYGNQRKIALNLEKSALADLVEIVKSGRFPNGVNLVVEKLDRIYRDIPRRAIEHFTSLLNYGVTIHTPLDNRIYRPDGDDLELINAVLQLTASHHYSKLLSDRIGRSVTRRVNEMVNDPSKIYRISRIPEWWEIEYEKQEVYSKKRKIKSIYVNEDNRQLIQEVFILYAQNLSTKDIANKFNNRGTRNFQNELWTANTIVNLIKSKSVMGIMIPKQGTEIFIENLKIIDKAEYKFVQDIMDNKIFQGKKSPDGNIFNGLIKCGYCLSRKKRYTGRPYTLSTLIYRPITDSNRIHTPSKTSIRHRGYICKSGDVSHKNCNEREVNYYKIYDAFFAFIKDLDFSSLIENKTKLQDKILQRKILEIKADISEIDININDQKRLLPLLKNENALKDIASEIDSLSDKKQELLIKLEDTKIILNEFENQKKSFVENEKNVKELIDKTFNDNVYKALTARMVYFNPLDGARKKIKPSKPFTKEELEEKVEIDRLWILPRKIIDSLKDKNNELHSRLTEEQDKLLLKYFSKEVEADKKGFEFKKKLNGELKKFIKEIVIYPFGFSLGEPTKPFDDREGESLVSEHKASLKAFLKGFKGNEISKHKPNASTGWEKREISKLLGISQGALRRYVDKDIIPDLSGTKESLKIIQDKLIENNLASAYQTIMHNDYSKFFGFSVEFTDLCKPDVIKYVLPYHQDITQGISFSYNKKTGKTGFGGSFGKKEIKLKRVKANMPKIIEDKYKDKDIFNVSDDPIYEEAFKLMFNHIGKTTFGIDGFMFGSSMAYTNNLPDNLSDKEKKDLKKRVGQWRKESLNDNE
jgi:hypothetical protein